MINFNYNDSIEDLQNDIYKLNSELIYKRKKLLVKQILKKIKE